MENVPVTTPVGERMTWQEIQAVVYQMSKDASLEMAGEIIRECLGTRLPWHDSLERWLIAQGLQWDETPDRRMAVMVFIQDHRETSLSPRLVQHIAGELRKAFCINSPYRQPLARFDLERVIGEVIREYVIKARGPLCHQTGMDCNAHLIDVEQPPAIKRELCGATMRAAIRAGSPGVCWCTEHVTQGGEGFEPLPADSRSLDSRTLRAAVAAIDALTCEELQNGGKPSTAAEPLRLKLSATEPATELRSAERAESTTDGE